MTHQRVSSSNIHSLAHEDNVLEVRFNCSRCGGTGKSGFVTDLQGERKDIQCSACNGDGHTGTYSYKGVPADLHRKLMSAPSVGRAFNLMVRGSHLYEVTKP